MKKLKIDKNHTPEGREKISKWLKKEKTRGQIAALLGCSLKVARYIIDRWELDEYLLIPKLRIVR